MNAEHRRERRSHVVMTARLRWHSGEMAVKLKDLSAGGVCAACPDAIAPGEPVELIRGDLAVPATVAWAAGGRIGLKFDQPIDEQAFRAQGQAATAPAVLPLHKPAERLSRRLEQHWAEMLNR